MYTTQIEDLISFQTITNVFLVKPGHLTFYLQVALGAPEDINHADGLEHATGLNIRT